MKQTLATWRIPNACAKKILSTKGSGPVRLPAARINHPVLPSREGASTARPRSSIHTARLVSTTAATNTIPLVAEFTKPNNSRTPADAPKAEATKWTGNYTVRWLERLCRVAGRRCKY